MRWAALAVAVLLPGGGAARAAEVLIVKSSDAAPYTASEAAARSDLAAKGNVVRTLLLKDLAEKGAEAGSGKADVVVAVGTPAAAWLQKQLPARVKLAYCMVPNPENAGLNAGRQATGVTTDLPIATQFQLIADALPKARVVGMLYRSDAPDGQRVIKAAKAALPKTWRLEAVAANEHASVADAIDALMKRNVDVIWTATDQGVYDAASVRTLLLASIRSRSPVFGFSTAFVRAGALIGVGVEPAAQGAQAAEIAQRLLADPKSLADRTETPKQYLTAVNLIVAGQLGIELPESAVIRASMVYRQEK